MYIKQQRVNNIRPKLAGLAPGTDLVITAPFSAMPAGGPHHASLAGLAPGESRLPRAHGSVSQFNAEGRYRVHRDRPKENRYVTTIEWTWEQWCGRGQTQTRSEFRDVYRDCYPRTFLAPPSVELCAVEIDGEPAFASPSLCYQEDKLPLIQHIVNLFLEIFGECELRQADLAPFPPAPVRRVNWELLPPGRHPWPQRRGEVQKVLRSQDARSAAPILHRQACIQGYGPAEIAVGIGGFTNYLAYIFPDKNRVLLESLRYGNATYVFSGEWEAFSQLSKAEVLSQGLCETRLIHTQGWERRLAEVMGAQPPLLRPVS